MSEDGTLDMAGGGMDVSVRCENLPRLRNGQKYGLERAS